MQTITIQIKNMVCPRCIHVVRQILNEMEIPFTVVDLGYATLITDEFPDFDLLNKKLEKLELGLIRDQNELLVSGINKAIHHYIGNIGWISRQMALSDFIAKELARNYHQLSKIYRKFTGTTIEQYFIELRTNKVKELIKQGDLNMSQIAITVGYSSIHYLSGQFKKYTGMSLTEYRKNWEEEVRMSFEKVRSGKGRKEECGCECGCEDCECEETQNHRSREVQLLPPGSPDSRDAGRSKFNPIPREFREFQVFVSL